MSVIEIADVTTEPSGPSLEAFGIDAPRAGQRRDEWGLDVRGWVIGAEAGRHPPVAGIEIVHDGEPLRRVPASGHRPDVADAHPALPRAATSGFLAPIGALGLALRFELRVDALLEDGTRVRLATITGRREPLSTGYRARLAPLMITTLGRTGSTAVVRLLGAHPEVVAYRPFEYEPRVATYWANLLTALADPVSYRRQIAPSGPAVGDWWLGEDPPFPGRVKDVAVQTWMGRESIDDLAVFCQRRIEGLYGRVAELEDRRRATFFVEKFRPDGVTALVRELFPAAREIVLVRDFRDMVASALAYNESRGYDGFGRMAAASDADWVANRIGPDALALAVAWRRRGASAHLMRYEELVQHPRKALTAALEYLQLDADPATLDTMLETLEAPESETHRTTGAAESIGRWQRDLSDDVREACAGALQAALREFGYEA